jgi:hypothetical protein
MTKFSCRLYNRGGKRSLSEVVVPVNVKPVKNPDDIAVNEQISGGGAQSKQIVQIMNQFWKKEEVKALAAEYGLEGTIYQQVCGEKFHDLQKNLFSRKKFWKIKNLFKNFFRLLSIFAAFAWNRLRCRRTFTSRSLTSQKTPDGLKIYFHFF